MPDERGQLTAKEHEMAYLLRCKLNEWGFAGDEMPVDQALSEARWTGLRQNIGNYQVCLYREGVTLWHDSQPYSRGGDGDPYGLQLAAYWPHDVGPKDEVFHPDLMPPIWRQSHPDRVGAHVAE